MTVAWIVLILATPATTADPGPHVKVEVSPKQEVWVGQRVALTIILATPDLFAGVPTFEIPPIPGTIVLSPSGSPDVGSEQFGDTTFTTQRHEFAVYAERPGTVHVPPFPIRFESNAGYSKPTIQRRVTTEEISFTAKNPPGSEGLGTVIAARDLKVTVGWQPEPKAVKVGDAFTLSVTVAASDVPGMVFPPLRFGPIDGVADYPKEPVVSDQTDRGKFTGQRTDSVTFICERPGTVTIPDRTLTWFDLAAGELKTEKLTGRTFEVIPDPTPEAERRPLSTPARSDRGWWWIVVSVVTAAIGWWLAMRILPWWKQVRTRRAGSEAADFALFRQACRSADPHAIYVALLGWLDHFGPISLDQFTGMADDPQLTTAVDDLKGRLYSQSEAFGPWSSARALFVRAKLARNSLRHGGRPTEPELALPPLNPSR